MSTAHVDAARWRRVEEVFDAAARLAPGERPEFLALRCGDDGPLRREVESLLDSHDRAEGFLETPAFEAADTPPAAGRRVGPYRLIRLIAMGGMGVVYEAEPEGGGPSVAIKVVRGGPLADPRRVRLFQREVRILSRLEHPSIAAVLGAGTTDDGQQYVAMECVRGESMNEYAQRLRLPIAERLRLFAGVCAAVDYAHQRGVIHRDLKPSNILVATDGGAPRVKVLDFGLARLSAPDAPVSTTLTSAGSVMGTLPYMSPEQASGRANDADERADVYALGVILYELLADRLPFDLNDSALHEAVRTICEAPPRPLDRALRGELETIALKALEKSPARRYPSAAALLEDVERHLAGRPILARPPGAATHVVRAIARHRVAFTFAASFFVVLSTASVWLAILYARALKADEIARGEAALAVEMNEFLIRMLATAGQHTRDGGDVTVRQVLTTTATGLELRPLHDPIAEATVRATLGNCFNALGDFDPAERQLRAAIELRRKALGAAHPDVGLAMADLGTVQFHRGDFPAAESTTREALALLRTSLGERHRAVAATLSQLASVRRTRGDLAGAELGYREAAAIQRGLGLSDDGELAGSLSNLADVLAETNRLDESRALYEDALRAIREAFGERSPAAAHAALKLAALLERMELFSDAETCLRDAIAVLESRFPTGHPTLDTARASLARVRASLVSKATAPR